MRSHSTSTYGKRTRVDRTFAAKRLLVYRRNLYYNITRNTCKSFDFMQFGLKILKQYDIAFSVITMYIYVSNDLMFNTLYDVLYTRMRHVRVRM